MIVDDLPMVSDDLLGAFASHLAAAARNPRYKCRPGKPVRFMGGYNLLAFGYFYQIPPIPSSASLAISPIHKKTEHAKQSLDLLWAGGEDFLTLFC